MNRSDQDDHEESLSTAATAADRSSDVRALLPPSPDRAPPAGLLLILPTRVSDAAPASANENSSLSSMQQPADEASQWRELTDPELRNLVKKNAGKYLDIASRFLRSKADAEDCAREALLKAWESRSQYDASCEFSPWFSQIVRRTALDYLRRRKRRIEMICDERTDVQQDASLNLEDSCDERISNSTIKDSLDMAFNKLPPKNAEVLRLRLDGLTDVEIAHKLGVTPDVVYGRARQGIEKLKKDTKLRESCDEQPPRRGRR